ncbi:MAG: type II toxin-antitoxin system RelE/ParE family toxin [Bryobacteraceae bacterium]
MPILAAIHRLAETGVGDVKTLQGMPGEKRLRVGDFRVRFTEDDVGVLRIRAVKHRKEAYR